MTIIGAYAVGAFLGAVVLAIAALLAAAAPGPQPPVLKHWCVAPGEIVHL